jgi:hypothetical protein
MSIDCSILVVSCGNRVRLHRFECRLRLHLIDGYVIPDSMGMPELFLMPKLHFIRYKPISSKQIMTLTPIRSFLCGLCLLPVLLSTAAPGARAVTNWNSLFPAVSPPARSYLALAYDNTSRKIVMFGGFDGRAYLQDTWTFDGTAWEKVDTAIAPPARTGAQMAYDHRTRKIVLFGGYDGRRYLGDTWLWDGATSTWTQATPAHSPKAVTGPMVFTDLNGRVDEFGGFSGNLYENTMWQWSGSDWRQLDLPQVPYARSAAGVGVNYVSKQIVLYGGLADVNPLNTWTYDGTTWTIESPSTQPLTVYGTSAAFEPHLNSVFLFGGANGGEDQNTIWSWTGSNWKELFPAQSPPAREGAGMAYDKVLGRIILFGGQKHEVPLGDTWELVP